MAGRVVWRQVAEQDLEDATLYIADNNEEAATRFLDAVDKAVLNLVEMPHLGRERSFHGNRTQNMRSWFVKDFNYIIFYVPLDDGIDVVRLLHGARDLPTLFEKGS